MIGDQLLRAAERPHLADQLRVLRAAGLLDRVLALPIDVGNEGGHELVSAHADMPVDPPDRERDVVSPERPPPGERVVIVRVDKRAVDVEERCGSHRRSVPETRRSYPLIERP